jgi:outer membrane immunogenic protein
MMKTVLMSAIALGAMAVTASAADMPVRGPAMAPAPYVAPIFTWTGFYVGVNAGAAWHGNDNCPGLYDYNYSTLQISHRVTAFGPACNSDDTAFTGGVQAGFNWQMGAVVFGLEGDVNWVGNESKQRFANYGYAIGGTTYNYTLDGNPQSNMLGGIRGRLGWSFDRALIYVTGGAAFRSSGDAEGIFVYKSDGTLLATYSSASNRNNVGWSLGGGLEWAFTNNVSFKIEYLHSQFDRGDGVYTTPVSVYRDYAFRNDSSRDSIDVMRFGINYRFGGPAPAPVLARY